MKYFNYNPTDTKPKKPNEIPRPAKDPEVIPREEPKPDTWPKKEPEIQPGREPLTKPSPAPPEIPTQPNFQGLLPGLHSR